MKLAHVSFKSLRAYWKKMGKRVKSLFIFPGSVISVLLIRMV